MKYVQLDRQSKQGAWIEESVPYGGHLAPYDIKPPLYLLEPDCVLVSSSIKTGLDALVSVLSKKKTCYFHMELSSHSEAFEGITEEYLDEVLSKIHHLRDFGKSVMYLPSHATLFSVYDEKEDICLFTHIFDYGAASVETKANPIYQRVNKLLSKVLNREYMVWKPSELPGSMASFVWSKRVILPKEIVYLCKPTPERQHQIKEMRSSKQDFKRKLK